MLAGWLKQNILVTIVILLAVFAEGSTGKALGLSYVGPVVLSHPQVYGMSGQQIDTIEVGEQGIIRIALLNKLDSVLPFVIIVEVRDTIGITDYIAWQTGTLDPSGNYTFETSWMPGHGCFEVRLCSQYQVRAFAVSNLVNPQVLSEVVESSHGITVVDTAPQPNQIYQVELNGTQLNVKYAIDEGLIESISLGLDLATITIQSVVFQDTVIVIEIPDRLIDLMVSCGNPIPGSSLPDLEVFVDTIPAERVIKIDGDKSSMFIVELPSGTEEVEFVAPTGYYC